MIYQQIIDYLSGEYRSGKTYQQIANEHKISFAYVRDLINGRCKPQRMSLEMFFKIFPRARIELADSADSAAADPGLAHELEVTRIERDSLRRELETCKRLCDALDSRVRDLEQRPPCARREETAPYHVGSATLSQSTKTGAPS